MHPVTQTRDGSTPLHCAVTVDFQEGVWLLISYGADSNAQRNDRQSPLHLAAKG